MTTVAPPPPPLPPVAPAAAPVVVTVAAPPASLIALALGTRLEALLMAQDGKGGLQVQTPLGTLNLQAPFSLPANASLTFAVQTQLPQIQLQLLTVNGRPAAGVLAQQAATEHGQVQGQGLATGQMPAAQGRGALLQGGAGATAASGPGGLPFVSLTAGTSMTATLLRPGLGLGAEAPVPPETQPGGFAALAAARAALATAKAQLGGMVDTALGLARGDQARSSGQPAAQPSAAAPAAPARTVALPAGTQVSVTLVSVQAPASGGEGQAASQPTRATGSPPVLARGAVLTGTVSGMTPTGQPVVQTPAGPLVLGTRQPVPQGATVTLEIKAPPLPPLAAPAAAPMLAGDPAQAKTWPALVEAVEVLREANPALAQQVLSGPIARPDSHLGAGMMFFLAAVKGGDLKGWLGDNALRALERARPGVAGRLREDFETRSKRSEEPSSDGWKTVAIPLQDGATIAQMKLMTRDHPEEETPEGQGGGARFVVDVDFSQSGRVQLDGLVFKKNKRLDLIVRTEGPLPEPTRDDIRAIFREAADLTGLQGGVTFQANPPMFVEPAQSLDPAAHRGVVV